MGLCSEQSWYGNHTLVIEGSRINDSEINGLEKIVSIMIFIVDNNNKKSCYTTIQLQSDRLYFVKNNYLVVHSVL